jgi:hypothetical protein
LASTGVHGLNTRLVLGLLLRERCELELLELPELGVLGVRLK